MRQLSLGSQLRAGSMKNRGQTLIGVLVVASIMAVLAMGFMSMFRAQSKASRSIAAHGGVTDLSHALDTLFGSAQCANTGSVNFSIAGASPVTVVPVAGTPPSYSLSMDTLKFSSGAIAITTNVNAAISAMINPYSVASIDFTALNGNSANQYPFKLTVTFASPGGAAAPLPLTKFIIVYTDALQNVVGACYSGVGTPSITNGVVTGTTSASANIVLPNSAAVVLAATIYGLCGPGAGGVTAGVQAVISIDGVACGRGDSWATGVYNASFSPSASCSEALSAGTHVLTVTNNAYGTGSACIHNQTSRLSYTVFDAPGL